MLKGQKKHIDKEQDKTKHEAHRSVNYRVTQNKSNIGTTALERSVVYTTGGGGGAGFKGLSLYRLLMPFASKIQSRKYKMNALKRLHLKMT